MSGTRGVKAQIEKQKVKFNMETKQKKNNYLSGGNIIQNSNFCRDSGSLGRNNTARGIMNETGEKNSHKFAMQCDSSKVQCNARQNLQKCHITNQKR